MIRLLSIQIWAGGASNNKRPPTSIIQMTYLHSLAIFHRTGEEVTKQLKEPLTLCAGEMFDEILRVSA